jgi:hypothetical protein
MGGLMAILLLAAAANLAAGWAVVNAAHTANPELRRAPQVVHFLAVVFWIPNVALAWWRGRKHRRRWRG